MTSNAPCSVLSVATIRPEPSIRAVSANCWVPTSNTSPGLRRERVPTCARSPVAPTKAKSPSSTPGARTATKRSSARSLGAHIAAVTRQDAGEPTSPERTSTCEGLTTSRSKAPPKATSTGFSSWLAAKLMLPQGVTVRRSASISTVHAVSPSDSGRRIALSTSTQRPSARKTTTRASAPSGPVTKISKRPSWGSSASSNGSRHVSTSAESHDSSVSHSVAPRRRVRTRHC